MLSLVGCPVICDSDFFLYVYSCYRYRSGSCEEGCVHFELQLWDYLRWYLRNSVSFFLIFIIMRLWFLSSDISRLLLYFSITSVSLNNFILISVVYRHLYLHIGGMTFRPLAHSQASSTLFLTSPLLLRVCACCLSDFVISPGIFWFDSSLYLSWQIDSVIPWAQISCQELHTS